MILACAAYGSGGNDRPAGLGDADTIAQAERAAKAFWAAVDVGNVAGAETHVFQREHRPPSAGRTQKTPVISARSKIEERRTFGRLKSRVLLKSEVMKEFANYPDGLFVRFTYAVVYEKKERSETLTIKADSPQRWSVVGLR
jgi:hypothetical protein